MKNLYLYIGYLFAFAVMISCGTDVVVPPVNLIEEDKMIDVIVEVELTQALVKLKLSNQDTINKQQFFNQVYTKFNISEEQFNESLAFYCEKPKDLMDMYVKVIAKLSEKQVSSN